MRMIMLVRETYILGMGYILYTCYLNRLLQRNPSLGTLFHIPKNRVLNLEGKLLLLAPLLRGKQHALGQSLHGSDLALG